MCDAQLLMQYIILNLIPQCFAAGKVMVLSPTAEEREYFPRVCLPLSVYEMIEYGETCL